MKSLLRRSWAPAAVALACGAGSSVAAAQDPFEIQVYDGSANPPGVPGLELHLNEWATGHRAADPPVAPLHGQGHATLEPSLGVLPFWEVGAYLQLALRADDGALDWAGVKARSKFVTPASWNPNWRLGLNLELSYVPGTYDRSRWGSEIRPIVAWQSPDWLIAFNPILDQSLGPPEASSGPSFEPAAKVARSLGPVALGVEYYGGLGPITAPLPARDQSHQVFEVVDVTSLPEIELSVGMGEGLTPSSAGIVLKAIVGYTFEQAATRPPLGASNLPAWIRKR
jgi:hypothetical protein